MRTRPARILIVDDDLEVRWALRSLVEQEGLEALESGDGDDALKIVRLQSPDVVLLDIRMQGIDGIEVLGRLRKMDGNLPVIMITAFGNIKDAVRTMKSGAYDYLTKPFENELVLLTIRRALEGRHLKRRLGVLDTHAEEHSSLQEMMGRSQAICKLEAEVALVAPTDFTVLVTGETGTGKELVARAIHALSPRVSGRMVTVNCGAIPETLIESELFGHEKGAFTDARVRKQGLLELADRGSLFLDEIGEMSTNLQVKLLKVLESMSFRRVGGTRDLNVQVRIISATNQDLSRMVAEGRFREDLFYRLMVVPIRMPSLRERREDIPLLAEHYIEHFSRAFRKRFKGVRPEAMAILSEYPWPGNIRELRNLFERTILLEDGEWIESHHLKLGVESVGGRRGGRLVDRLREVLEEGRLGTDGVPFEAWIEEIERGLISRAFEAAAGNQTRTAEILQTTRDKLRYRMKQYGMRENQAFTPRQ